MLQLSSADNEMLSGALGEGTQLAAQMVVHMAQALGARKLIDIKWAHVSSAYYQGQANIDFARRLADSGTRVAVPTTLTACSLNLRDEHAHSPHDRKAVELIRLYEYMGCDPVMTCAPYHAHAEPRFGDHLAWCESSAVAYANSVLGARTNQYVEFLDMCAAVTGRVPDFGLHRTENRCASILFRVAEMPQGWLQDAWFYQVLGIVLGQESGASVPAVAGLPADCTNEQLRAMGSAAASSGSVCMFHAIGITPEADDQQTAFHGREPQREVLIDARRIAMASNELGRYPGTPLDAICLGAPHFSLQEFEVLDELLSGRKIASSTRFYAATSATVLQQIENAGVLERLMNAGVEFVVGRCTYYRPALSGTEGHVMTNSAKWAYYAPSALGANVTFATLAECVESACEGRVVLEEEGSS